MADDYGITTVNETVDNFTQRFADPIWSGDEGIYPMGTGVTINIGEMVCVNSSGYAVPAADTSGYKFLGIAMETKINSGADAANVIRVRRRGVIELAATSIAQSSVGLTMYVADKDTFDESAANYVVCGRLVKVVSATSGWLSIDEAVYAPATPIAADAMTVSDAGNYFPAATNTVAEQIQVLASTPILICASVATIATAASDVKIIENMEFPVPVRIKRAYATLGTAPGSGKTLTVEIKVAAGADATLCTVAGTAVVGENEALDIAVAADTDIDIQLTQDTGAAAALNLVVVAVLDDGE